MNRRLNRLSRALGLKSAPAPFHLEADDIRRQVHDILTAEERERKAYMKQKVKFAAVLVAAAVALTGTALAVGPTLQEMIHELMGKFAPYAQEITGVSATDQGIEIKVTATAADRRNARIILEIRDLKGSRITGDNLKLDLRPDRAEAEGNQEHAAFGIGTEGVGYDEKTGTALYQLDFMDMSPYFYEDAPIELYISAVNPGIQEFDDWPLLPVEHLTGKKRPSRRLATGETILVPEQNSTEFEGTKGVALSSMGIASDGLLHLQFRMPEDALVEHNTVHAFVWRNSDDPQRVREYYDHTAVYFQDNGTSYKDLTYPVTADELSEVHIEELCGGYRTAQEIKGEWNLSVPLEEIPERVITVNQPLGGLMVKTISISALSATADTQPIPGEKVHYRIPGLPLTLYYKAGTHEFIKARNNWDFEGIIDPNDVNGLALGQWYVSLDGDVAQSARWLPELPE